MKVLNKIKLEDVLFLDIETTTIVPELQLDTPLFDAWEYKKKSERLPNEELISSFKKEGALYGEFGRIACISIGRLFKGDFVTATFNDFDEGVMIKKFYEVLDKQDWLLCGHAIKDFDIPYIFKRSIANGVIPHKLIDTSGLKPWEINWIIDTKELWAAGGFNKSSLLSITTVLGLPSPKGGIIGEQVPAYFWDDPTNHIKEISDYCERDVRAVYDIMNRFKNIDSPHSKQPTEIENAAIIQHLFNGGEYDEAVKSSLLEMLKNLTKEDQDRSFVILDSIVSGAAKTKTHLTKTHVKQLKTLCNE